MAWTAPRTWVHGEIVSAANMNTHIRDNFLETAVGKASAAGQVPYATGANALAMLSAVAYRMPRFNAAASAIEAIAGLNLVAAVGYNTANSVNSSTSLQNIVTLDWTSVGGKIVVIAMGLVREAKSSAGAMQHQYAIVRDGVIKTGGGAEFLQDGYAAASATVGSSMTLLLVETPAAGTYTYAIAARYANFSTSGTPLAWGQILLAEFAP